MKVKEIQPKVSIILINYNTKCDTVECLNSLKNIDYKNYNVIVVDNNSKDIFETDFSEIYHCDLILSLSNGGFSAGNNIGIRYAESMYSPDYYLLLNNDTVVDIAFLTQLVQTAENHKNDVGGVSGRICYYSNHEKIDYCGGYFDRRSGRAHYYKLEERCNGEREITFATGCLLLLPKSTIERVGYLNEMYFMYGEDVDYSCKIIDCNKKIYYNDNAIVFHKISASTDGAESNFNQYYMTRNNLYLISLFSKCKKVAFLKFAVGLIKAIILRKKRIFPIIQAFIAFRKKEIGKSEKY